MKFELTVTDEAQTEAFATVLANHLRGGEYIELIGDVGAGKTTFTRYLVAQIGSEDHVSSPTFTISNQYHGGTYPVYHFDFYRLGDNDTLIKHELAEVIEQPEAVVILEWANPIASVLDKEPVQITIVNNGETERRITVSIPAHYAYIGGSA